MCRVVPSKQFRLSFFVVRTFVTTLKLAAGMIFLYRPNRRCVGVWYMQRVHLAIGNFDGIHLGHRALFRKAVEDARKDQNIPAVLTFHPHPKQVLKLPNAPQLIYPIHQRCWLLRRLGFQKRLCRSGRWIVTPPCHSRRTPSFQPSQFFGSNLLPDFFTGSRSTVSIRPIQTKKPSRPSRRN